MDINKKRPGLAHFKNKFRKRELNNKSGKEMCEERYKEKDVATRRRRESTERRKRLISTAS